MEIESFDMDTFVRIQTPNVRLRPGYLLPLPTSQDPATHSFDMT